MAARPAAVAFDVIETLMPLEPLRARFVRQGLPPHLLELWFTRTLRNGFALAAAGDYAPFSDVARRHCGSCPDTRPTRPRSPGSSPG